MKSLLLLLFLAICGCSSLHQKPELSPQVVLTLLSEDATKLKRNSLPADGLSISDEPLNSKKMRKLSDSIAMFNDNGDRLISEIFAPLHKNKRFDVQVIAIQGIPAPYDAWTASFNDRDAIFINLSQWTLERIDRVSLPVIKHEIAHVLLEPLLKRPDPDRPIEVLEDIVINEGIAHFIGYVRSRDDLLKERALECKTAESELDMAIKKLKDLKTTNQETKELLEKANTGAFWMKYGAIAGMCRAAITFKELGPVGLTEAIKASRFLSL